MVSVRISLALGFKCALATLLCGMAASTAAAEPPSNAGASKLQTTKQVAARKGPAPAQAKRSPQAPPQPGPVKVSLGRGCLPAAVQPIAVPTAGASPDDVSPNRLATHPTRAYESGCLNYAVAVASTGQTLAAAILERREHLERPVIASYSRSASEASLGESEVDLEEVAAQWRELELPALPLEAMTSEELEILPHQVRWTLGQLVGQIGRNFTLSAVHKFRIVLRQHRADEAEVLHAVELINVAAGHALETVLWLDRDHAPGGFFSSSGNDYERQLWLSPTQEIRISRGVGKGVARVKKRVAVKVPGKASPRMVTRSFLVRGQHIGIDFVAPAGTPVRAVADAAVTFAGDKGGYGNLVVLSHAGGYESYYGHLSGFTSSLMPGERVARGQVIGYVGSTGWSTGPHLHFEVRKDGVFIDPLKSSDRLPFLRLDGEEQGRLLTAMLMLDATRRPGALAFAQPSESVESGASAPVDIPPI